MQLANNPYFMWGFPPLGFILDPTKNGAAMPPTGFVLLVLSAVPQESCPEIFEILVLM